MDGQNIEDVEELIVRLKRERARLIDQGMQKDGELALIGKANMTKTDESRRRTLVAEKKDIERRAYNIKEQLRLVEDGKMKGLTKMVAPTDVPKITPILPQVDVKAEEQEDMRKDDAAVTDHAVVRWLERKHGMNVAEMRRDIYAEAMDEGGTIYKSGAFYKVVRDGFVYVVCGTNKTVVTCYENNGTYIERKKQNG